MSFVISYVVGIVCDCELCIYEMTLRAEKTSVFGGNENWTNIQEYYMQILLEKDDNEM